MISGLYSSLSQQREYGMLSGLYSSLSQQESMVWYLVFTEVCPNKESMVCYLVFTEVCPNKESMVCYLVFTQVYPNKRVWYDIWSLLKSIPTKRVWYVIKCLNSCNTIPANVWETHICKLLCCIRARTVLVKRAWSLSQQREHSICYLMCIKMREFWVPHGFFLITWAHIKAVKIKCFFQGGGGFFQTREWIVYIHAVKV